MDQEVARADYPPHCEAFPVRLRGARRLNLPPPANALARLRIFEHCVLSVNLVLPLEVVRIGGGPVAIQSPSNLSVFQYQISLTIAVDVEPSYHALAWNRPSVWGRRAIPSAEARAQFVQVDRRSFFVMAGPVPAIHVD